MIQLRKGYKISVFRNDILDFQFSVSLQPTGDDKILPTYQLFPRDQKVPRWIFENLNVVSDWLKLNEK